MNLGIENEEKITILYCKVITRGNNMTTNFSYITNLPQKGKEKKRKRITKKKKETWINLEIKINK